MMACVDVKSINIRQCTACKQDKHLRFFPLVYPDDPTDFRRVSLCEPCVRKAKAILKKTDAFKGMLKERRKVKWRPYKAAMASYRKAVTLKAMPYWVDRDKIDAVYRLCAKISKQSGIKHHVDHIVPLIHPRVCGLHVPANLQILTQTENCKKSNKFQVG